MDEERYGDADAAVSDADLASQALAADPDVAIPDDAVSFWELTRPEGDDEGLLPDWYMPAPATTTRPARGWRRRVAVGLTGTFVLINAAGLCSTYGWVTIA